MCQNCKDPNSEEGKAVRAYLKSLGRNYTEAEIVRRTRHLKSLKDEFILKSTEVGDFTPSLDTMPDGVHAKTRLKWKNIFTARQKGSASERDDRQGHCEKLLEEYNAIQGEKPDYLQWAAEHSRPQIFEELYHQAVGARHPVARVKACSTLLEFTKTKPKRELELSQGEISGDLPDLFRQLCKLMFIPPEAADAFLGAYVKTQPMTDEIQPVKPN